ncbi:hypothetical protein CMEL01_14262 [Colletotrichum melonis]|uniref:Uncharacterized protein n=2 Tax=Colletotrichum acutatum species complex TaxID=2707335 RepID=A0AAI9XWS3_9PEZI|nr:hypothetical protein CMEL01_14262 [Colletotrichum melonis]
MQHPHESPRPTIHWPESRQSTATPQPSANVASCLAACPGRTHDPGPCPGCWTGTASSFNSWPWLARAGVPPKPIRFRAAYQTTLSRYLSVPARSNLPNECLPSIRWSLALLQPKSAADREPRPILAVCRYCAVSRLRPPLLLWHRKIDSCSRGLALLTCPQLHIHTCQQPPAAHRRLALFFPSPYLCLALVALPTPHTLPRPRPSDTGLIRPPTSTHTSTFISLACQTTT